MTHCRPHFSKSYFVLSQIHLCVIMSPQGLCQPPAGHGCPCVRDFIPWPPLPRLRRLHSVECTLHLGFGFLTRLLSFPRGHAGKFLSLPGLWGVLLTGTFLGGAALLGPDCLAPPLTGLAAHPWGHFRTHLSWGVRHRCCQQGPARV